MPAYDGPRKSWITDINGLLRLHCMIQQTDSIVAEASELMDWQMQGCACFDLPSHRITCSCAGSIYHCTERVVASDSICIHTHGSLTACLHPKSI